MFINKYSVMKSIFVFIIAHLFMPLAYAGELKIGWIGPLSGNSAVLGVDSLEALRIAVDEENNSGSEQKITILAEDDQYLTSKSLAAYERLVNIEKVRVIFLLTYGAQFALAEKAKKDNVVLIDTLDCDEKLAALNDNIFCAAKSTEDLGRIVGEKAKEHQHTPGIILTYASDPFMIILAKSTLQILDNASPGSYIDEYNKDQTDFRSMLLRAKTRNVKSIFFFGYDEMSYAMKQARELGITANFYAINTVSSPNFIKGAGQALENTFIATWSPPAYTDLHKKFLETFVNRVGHQPNFEVSLYPTYDVGKVVTKVLSVEQGEDLALVVKKALFGLRDYNGLSGNITIDNDGACRTLKSRRFRSFIGGKFVDVK